MDELLTHLIEKIVRHRGKVAGAAIGLVAGLMIVLFGVIKSLFILLCVGVGYLIGSRFDGDDSTYTFPSRRRLR